MFGTGLAIDNNDNILVTGGFNGTVDFDPNQGIQNYSSNANFNPYSRDIFILKLDSAGEFIWVRQIGNQVSEYAESIYVDSDNSIYTVGSFSQTIDFDPGSGSYALTSLDNADGFIHKLNSNGEFIWAKQIGGDSGQSCNIITIDSENNIFIGGGFRGPTDFDLGSGVVTLYPTFTIYGGEIFILKADTSGSFEWVKPIFGDGSITMADVTTDQSGNIYTMGEFTVAADFDPGLDSAHLEVTGSIDVFIQKLDTAGEYLWTTQLGGPSTPYNISKSIVIDQFDNIYSTGGFRGTVDFDPGPDTHLLTSVAGSWDIYVQRIKQCGNDTVIDEISTCKGITWIDGNTYSSNNNTAEYFVPKLGGCDSMVTLNLTIVPLNLGLSIFAATLISNQSGASYQWLDCLSDHSVIQNATDQSYNPTLNGSYAVIVTQNGCSDTSDCSEINTVGVMDIHESKFTQLFPNPTDGGITLRFNTVLDHGAIQIFDVYGKLIEEQSFQNKQQILLAAHHLSNGCYFIRIRSGDRYEDHKFLKF
jgi:hypothetical protein